MLARSIDDGAGKEADSIGGNDRLHSDELLYGEGINICPRGFTGYRSARSGHNYRLCCCCEAKRYR